MSAQIIDGKALAAATKAEAAAEAAALKAKGIEPCLAVILVGENPASQVYVRGKVKDCGECGIKSLELRMPETTTQEELLAKIAELAADKTVNGILVQLPLPKQIDERAVIDAIPPEKDVDGFSPVNVGRMQTGQPCFLPCTPAGCIRMIESTGTDIAGKNAVVIGRSNIVGKPAALMNKEDKVRAIRFLNQNGAFLVTKSGDKIAKYFGISKYTLYSYIDTKQQEGK